MSVLILLYVMTVGMLAPLATGIVRVDKLRINTNTTFVVQAEGYNSHYQAAAEGQTAYLVLDSIYLICAKNIEVENDNFLKASFDIPEYLPFEKTELDVTLVINNSIDGASLLPVAATLVQKEPPNLDSVIQNWQQCEMVVTDNGNYDFPYRNLLSETIRNTYFHVPLWFGMMIILFASMIYSILYLLKGSEDYFEYQAKLHREKKTTLGIVGFIFKILHWLSKCSTFPDSKSLGLVRVGTLFGILGLITGALWAKYTWGEYWSFDIKQNMAAVAMLIYLAYFVLRGSFEDEQARARLSAVYNIFAFATLIPLLYVIPRLVDSLHPGNGGNPGFGGEDLDNTMRTIFYPAIIGWTLFGVWMANLSFRIDLLKEKWLDRED